MMVSETILFLSDGSNGFTDPWNSPNGIAPPGHEEMNSANLPARNRLVNFILKYNVHSF